MIKPYSAVIITLNEEKNIESCIKALLHITSDIVVVDAHSKDKTVDIAKSLGASVFVVSWKGYGYAKNYGIEKCKNNWVISVDADEYVSDKLIESLLTQKLDVGQVYSFNILPNYCNQWIRFGSWHPDWNIRLFNRKDISWNESKVHEKLIGLKNKKVVKVIGMLHHYSYRSIEEHLARIDRYARLAALEMIDNQQSSPIIKNWLGPMFRFIKSYVLRLGFFDGYYGYVIAKNEALFVKKRVYYYKRYLKENNR